MPIFINVRNEIDLTGGCGACFAEMSDDYNVIYFTALPNPLPQGGVKSRLYSDFNDDIQILLSYDPVFLNLFHIFS